MLAFMPFGLGLGPRASESVATQSIVSKLNDISSVLVKSSWIPGDDA